MLKKFVLAVGSLVAVGTLSAQVQYSGGTYLQDFDTLANTGTPAWADNTTIPGFYALFSATGAAPATYVVGTGSATTGGLYSYGAAGSTDRALGSLSSGTPQTVSYGIRFVNQSSFTFDSLVVNFTGEQWRNGGNVTPQSLDFAYAIGSGLTINGTGFTSVPQLTFTSPVATASAGALDGNVNSQSLSFTISGITWAPGQEVFIRFQDVNDAGNDHGLAVDNFSFQATQVPEPSSVALGLLGLAGIVALRRRR